MFFSNVYIFSKLPNVFILFYFIDYKGTGEKRRGGEGGGGHGKAGKETKAEARDLGSAVLEATAHLNQYLHGELNAGIKQQDKTNGVTREASLAYLNVPPNKN